MADRQDGETETGKSSVCMFAIVPTAHKIKSGDPSSSSLELAFSGRGGLVPVGAAVPMLWGGVSGLLYTNGGEGTVLNTLELETGFWMFLLFP